MSITHPKTHILIGPGLALSRVVTQSGVPRITTKIVQSETDFDAFLQAGMVPEYAVIWGFIKFKARLLEWASIHNVKLAFGELGWFPHYESFALDPDGFCWESSIPNTKYDQDPWTQHPLAVALIQRTLLQECCDLPPEVKPPYVLWAGQMVSDHVNMHGMNCVDWCALISHFRGILPLDTQLVIRPHPGITGRPAKESEAHKKLTVLAMGLPNTVLTPKGDLHSLISSAAAVVGMNSTVLMEASLLYGKQVYAYGKSWYTNHDDLVTPLSLTDTASLPLPADSITFSRKRLWFIEQLLSRQVERDTLTKNPVLAKQWLDRWSCVPNKRIPRDAYFVWIGGSEMPAAYKQNLEDFKYLNPDIRTTLITDKGVDDVLSGVDAVLKTKYKQARYPQQKADILRSCLLYLRGGVCFDLDFAWIRPLPDELFSSGDWCGSNHRTPYENGEVGFLQGSLFLKDYLRGITRTQDTTRVGCFGPALLVRLFKTSKHLPRVLPWWWFNPLRGVASDYKELMNIPVNARSHTLGVLSGDTIPRGQLPVAQHLHGSINNQYRNQESL